ANRRSNTGCFQSLPREIAAPRGKVPGERIAPHVLAGAGHAAHPGLLTRGIARLVWLGLLLAGPLLAERRNRLVAPTLGATVRSIVRGEHVSAAVDRGVRGLVRHGLSPERARDDLDRLLAGFVSGAVGGPRHAPWALGRFRGIHPRPSRSERVLGARR